jgi:O-antigen/teichoic acid export membrane protein
VSRKRLFIRGLAVGYVAMGANIAYSLVSIPLALNYLGKEQFGMWAVILQIVSYLHLLDFGISNGVSRILIDEKDNRASGAFGSVLLTGSIAQVIIGASVAAAGWLGGGWAARLFAVPTDLAGDFALLIASQATIAGIGISARMLGAPLMAYQRQDLMGYQTIGTFVIYLGTMFGGFQLGWGLYSMVASMAAGLFWVLAFNLFFGLRLGLLPKGTEWGRPSFTRFRGIFAYSKDLFLMGLGWQLLNGSPILVISRTLGLDSSAAWSVCIKPFQILIQFLSRPADLSFPAFSEMYVRGEIDLLRSRLRQIYKITAAMAAVAAGSMAFLNPEFVRLWTGGRVEWPLTNHVALALYAFVFSVMRVTNGFVGITKKIRGMKYAFFAEGIVFVGLAIALSPQFGVAIIPVLACLCHLLISSPLGLWYLAEDLRMGYADPLRWAWRAPVSMALVSAVGMLVYTLLSGQGTLEKLVAETAIMGFVSFAVLIFFALDVAIRGEVWRVFKYGASKVGLKL